MILFWIVLIGALLFYFVSKKYSHKESVTFTFILLAWALIIVAIVQKDPLFTSFGVPPEFEWVVGLFIAALSSWQLYFDPLKKRVLHTETEVNAIKTDVTAIKADTTLIKEKLLQKK